MLIIPSINGHNIQKFSNLLRILKGYVSVLRVDISADNKSFKDIIQNLNKQTAEVEILIEGENHGDRLTEMVNTHSDLNIGKVFFYTKNPESVENEITQIRIFGIQPGIIIDSHNFNIPTVLNKFEFGVINTEKNSDYMNMYKQIKDNLFKGNLLLDFREKRIPIEVIKNMDIDGVYIDVTNNPAIKDTISSYRRAANEAY